MDLRSYLSRRKLNFSEAARELGVPPQSVNLWVRRARIPRPEYMLRIYRWSSGQVQPNDFYDLAAAGALDGLPLFAAANGAGAPPGADGKRCKGGP